MQANTSRSTPLKRSMTTQSGSGRTKRVATGNRHSSFAGITSSPLDIALCLDMAPADGFPMTSSQSAYGSSTMAPQMSQMSQMSQMPQMPQMSHLPQLSQPSPMPFLSHRNSPSPHIPVHQQPYCSRMQGTALAEENILMNPSDYLLSVGAPAAADSACFGLSSSGPFTGYDSMSEPVDLDALAHNVSLDTIDGSDSTDASDLRDVADLTDRTHLTDFSDLADLSELSDPFALDISTADMVLIQSQQSFLGDLVHSHDEPATHPGSAFGEECIRGTGSLHATFPAHYSYLPLGGFAMEPSLTIDTNASFDQGRVTSSLMEQSASRASDASQSSQLSQANQLNQPSRQWSATAMERSSSSQSSRLRETARRQVSNAGKNQIRPKGNAAAVFYPGCAPHPALPGSVPGSVPSSSLSPTHSGIDGKVKITKARRERPKTNKLRCKLCDRHADGFRGPHELQRHISRHHESSPKRYICVDPRASGVALRPGLVLYKALADCKNCRENKAYGADYNAAAHLRRAHFRERPQRNKIGRAQQDGGSGGSGATDANSYPPMEDLKDWIREDVRPSADRQADGVMRAMQFSPEEYDVDADFNADGDGIQPGRTPAETGYDLGSQSGDYSQSAVPRIMSMSMPMPMPSDDVLCAFDDVLAHDEYGDSFYV